MKRYSCDAVVFDLDGVLVDSAACIERHWRRWAKRHGIDAASVLEVAQGRPTAETISLVAPHLDVEAEASALSHAEAADTAGLLRIAGAAELLAALPDGSWAVATSGATVTATTRLLNVGLPLPEVLVTADDVSRGKPDPEPYQLAAARMGVEPAKCIVIEDTPTGVTAALAADMRVIGLVSTHAPEQLAEADAVVRGLADVAVVASSSGRRVALVVTDISGLTSDA